MTRIKAVIPATALAFLVTTSFAQEPPRFYQDTYPEYALKARLQAEEVLIGESATLNGKTRELVALGVAAQIPCAYCVYFHTQSARALGASETEIREAVAIAAHSTAWPTTSLPSRRKSTRCRPRIDQDRPPEAQLPQNQIRRWQR